MLIGSKLPPVHGENTYFNLGRSAFAYLMADVIKPKKVYLPSFTCWSLVSTLEKRFPHIEMEFYPVNRELECTYPEKVNKGEVLVFMHYFGKENKQSLPPCEGILLEDISHAIATKLNYRGNYIFGSLRKFFKIADGGIIKSHHNPVYEPSKKLDTWLRYEAIDWRDMREAENMIDRSWNMTDISSQSLEIVLRSNLDIIRTSRNKNEKFLFDNIEVGSPLLEFQAHEAPLLHNRILESTERRDSLRKYLAEKGVFTSIHWPTHPSVKKSNLDITDILYLESHIISIPVSPEYNLNDMEFIASTIASWAKNQ